MTSNTRHPFKPMRYPQHLPRRYALDRLDSVDWLLSPTTTASAVRVALFASGPGPTVLGLVVRRRTAYRAVRPGPLSPVRYGVVAEPVRAVAVHRGLVELVFRPLVPVVDLHAVRRALVADSKSRGGEPAGSDEQKGGCRCGCFRCHETVCFGDLD